MSFVNRTVALLIAGACAHASAEILHGVGPLDTLGDLKKKYPNANIKAVKAAWVTEEQGFYKLDGEGFPGELYVAFTDTRPHMRSMASNERKAAAAANPPREPRADIYEALSKQSDDEALTVNWVRWVPTRPIPLERYKSKYGEPAKCDFTEDTMQPYCSWPAKALMVSLSDDRKMVLRADAQFTKAELRAAYLAKLGEVPDFLKEPHEASTTKERKPAAVQPR